jgi:SAM-dependent methyltransferase
VRGGDGSIADQTVGSPTAMRPTRSDYSHTAAILADDGGVRGYSDSTYGDAFADVYDDWYDDSFFGEGETQAAIDALVDLYRRCPADVLELGVGTGRLAIPLAAAMRAASDGPAHQVFGIDSSEAMIAALRRNDPFGSVAAHLGDMAAGVPVGAGRAGGPTGHQLGERHFGLVVAAYNCLFNLRDCDHQRRCIETVAAALVPGGHLVVECFVPVGGDSERVGVRSMTANRVVLSVSRSDESTQTAQGQFVEFTEGAGVRLRPWSIRWLTVQQLDELAAEAGLRLSVRWSDWHGSAFTESSERHISVYTPHL